MQAQASQVKSGPAQVKTGSAAPTLLQRTFMSRLNPLTHSCRYFAAAHVVEHVDEKPKAGAVASPDFVYESVKAPVTKDEVIAVQTAWANAIERISKVYKEKGDYVQAAADAAGELYAYGKGDVLFKPTKAAEYQFRPTPESAMSYFVGGKAVDNGYTEDGGFAINGGKGWSKVVYDNHQIVIKGDVALAMGNYFFTCATTGDVSKVEYTFGYERCDDGKVRIFLHHSSVPYTA